jgi:hypothetical protein
MKRPVWLAAIAAALALGGISARAEVEKFMNPCEAQQLCASFRLVLTPPDGWELDAQATKENNVQIIVPKGKTFATAEPLIYVQVFYHKDRQQTLDDFARVSNARWLAAVGNARIAALPAVARANGKPGFLRFSYENPNKTQQAYEMGAFGIDTDKDGNEFVLDVVMTGNSRKALDRAEKDYVALLKAH